MNTPFDQTLESDIKELMKEVPAPVRAVFASGKVETVAKSLMQKYKLHIDQGAVVEREVILLLLGLKSPDEFTGALAEEAKLDQQIINSIVKDVNDQIFVPLREEMRKGASAEVKPPHPQPQRPLSSPKATHGKAELRNVLASVTKEVPKLLEDHEEPHIDISNKVQGVSLPPPNLPGVIHHPPLPIQKPVLPVPPPKPYSSDPYREPIV